MAKHVCCITINLLDVDADFATHLVTLTWLNGVDYLTAIRPLLPYRRGMTEETTGPIGIIHCVRFRVMHRMRVRGLIHPNPNPNPSQGS